MRVRPASAKERLVHQRNRSNTFQAHKDRPESETKLIDYTAPRYYDYEESLLNDKKSWLQGNSMYKKHGIYLDTLQQKKTINVMRKEKTLLSTKLAKLEKDYQQTKKVLSDVQNAQSLKNLPPQNFVEQPKILIELKRQIMEIREQIKARQAEKQDLVKILKHTDLRELEEQKKQKFTECLEMKQNLQKQMLKQQIIDLIMNNDLNQLDSIFEQQQQRLSLDIKILEKNLQELLEENETWKQKIKERTSKFTYFKNELKQKNDVVEQLKKELVKTAYQEKLSRSREVEVTSMTNEQKAAEQRQIESIKRDNHRLLQILEKKGKEVAEKKMLLIEQEENTAKESEKLRIQINALEAEIEQQQQKIINQNDFEANYRGGDQQNLTPHTGNNGNQDFDTVLQQIQDEQENQLSNSSGNSHTNPAQFLKQRSTVTKHLRRLSNDSQSSLQAIDSHRMHDPNLSNRSGTMPVVAANSQSVRQSQAGGAIAIQETRAEDEQSPLKLRRPQMKVAFREDQQ